MCRWKYNWEYIRINTNNDIFSGINRINILYGIDNIEGVS